MEFKLRKFKKEDIPSLTENINDVKISRNTAGIPYPYNKKDAIFWINKTLKQYKEKNHKRFVFAIDVNGEVAGSIGIHKIDRENKNAEIGYWLTKKYRGRGIMTKATKEITKYAFKKYKLKRVWATVYPFNKESARVLEKANFKYEGTLKKAAFKNGKFLDKKLYAKVK